MKLIDKDAVLAEINKRASRVCGKDLYAEVKRGIYSSLIIFIDSMEVTEVDLEKKIQDYWNEHQYSHRLQKQVEDGFGESLIRSVAKHFFELGLSINRRDTNWPVIDSMLIEKGIDPYSKEAKLFEERCFAAIDAAIEILKAQKGEKV